MVKCSKAVPLSYAVGKDRKALGGTTKRFSMRLLIKDVTHLVAWSVASGAYRMCIIGHFVAKRRKCTLSHSSSVKEPIL